MFAYVCMYVCVCETEREEKVSASYVYYSPFMIAHD